MGRMYAVAFDNVAVTNAGGDNDIFELVPAANKPIILHEVHITDVDSETDEKLRFTIKRLAATVTSGNGTSVTPVPLDVNDAAAGFTAERVGTTVATTSTTTSTLHAEGASALVGFHYVPTEKARPRCAASEALVVRLEAAPGSDRNMSGVCIVEEL